jgi:uncharacterized protein YfaS (alpha-2-macroglobulin family)
LKSLSFSWIGFVKTASLFLLLPFASLADKLTVDFGRGFVYGQFPLQLSFSEPMIPLGYPADSVPKGLLLTPHIPGKWSWSWNSQSTLFFYPDSVWRYGNRYTITVPAGVSSKISGNYLKRELKKEVTVGKFSGRIYSNDIQSTVSFVSIHFDLPVHPDSLRRHLTCTQQSLQLLTSDSLYYSVRPKTGWKEGRNTTLSVDAGLTPRNGNMPLDSALSTSFNISDTIKFLGLFRNGKKVSLSDTLFLEDDNELRFSHPLDYAAIGDYSLINGQPSDQTLCSGNRIDVNRFLLPGKLTTLSLKAGLPSEDSAYLFNDLQFVLIGDRNRIDPAMPAFSIKEVLVRYDEKDSIPPLPVSLKTPVRLLPKMKFDFVSEKPDSLLLEGWSLYCVCFTPDGKVTLDWKDHYIYPEKLPPNANCTLMVEAGYRIGDHQLKRDFVAIFRTGVREFPESCRPVINRRDGCYSWKQPHNVLLPVSPAVPLKRYGSPRVVTAIRVIPKSEELLSPDSTRFLPHSWLFDTIPSPVSGVGRYDYVPLRLAPALSANGYGIAEVLLSVNSEKYDTLGRFVVTDLGVQLMKFRPSTAVIVTSLTKRLPVAGADVTLVGKENSVLAHGATDSSGFFQVPRPLSPCFVVVATSDDTIVYKTQNSSYTDTARCDGILITERGLYRPGDTLFFKGIVRRLRDRWEPEVADSAVVAIAWEKAEPFLDTLPLSGCGSFSGMVRVPPEVAQRSYTIRAELLHAEGSLSSKFKVVEFRSAELSASVGKGVVGVDSVNFLVNAKWLHGGAAGLSLFTWICETSLTALSWPGEVRSRGEYLSWDNYRWGLKNRREINRRLTGSAILDSTGSAVVAVTRLPDDSGLTYLFSATVEGSAVQSAETPGSVVEIPCYQIYIGIAKNTALVVGDTVPLVLKSVREDGLAVKGIELHTDIIHNIPVKKHSKNRYGLPAVVWDTAHVKVRTDYPVTDSQGIARLSTTALPEGNYSVTAEPKISSSQEQFTYDFTISVPNPEEQYKGHNYTDNEGSEVLDSFSIIEIDSGVHDVGDKVRFQLKAAQDSCNVLLTVSRENIYEHLWISMTGRDTIIALALRNECVPIVKIQAIVFPPLRRTSKGLAFEQRNPIKTVSVTTHVSDDCRHVPVKVTTDHNVYAPGDTVTVHITIPSKSASSTALVMVVDEGVLQLGTTSGLDINGAFAIDTNNVLHCFNECSIRHFYGPFDYDSCNALRLHPKFGGEGDDDNLRISSPEFLKGGCLVSKREKKQNGLRNFPRPCAYFNPEVKFDTGGKAVCRFKLPGNLTRWRVTAIVDDTTSFGVDTTSFEANKPLMIRPQLPRFLRVGDSASGVYIVENRSKCERNITSGAIVHSDTAADTFTLHNDALRSCRFPLIGRTIGTDSLLFLVHSDTLADGVKLGITTISERPHNVAAIGGSTIDSARIPLVLPQSATIDSGNLQLSLSTTRMQNLREGVRYLFDYPYGCLEQRSSKVMPLLVLGDFATRFHLAMLDKSDERATIQTYLDHIGDFQNKSDGGLDYWSSTRGRSDPWLTAFVLEIVIKAKAAGYAVNDSVYTKAFAYLKRELHQKEADGKKLFIDSYIQLIMAQAGKPDRTALQKLYKTRGSLPLSAQINLLRAMYLTGNFKRKVAVLQKQLQHGLIENDRLAYFAPERSKGFEFCHESPVRQTALALEALLETGSKSRFDEPMIRWLTEQRRCGRWRTTQENMAVFRAFAAYTNVYERDFPKINAGVKLDGSDWFFAALEGREGVGAQELRSLDSISAHGETAVSLNCSGTGRLYWDLLMSTFPAGNSLPVSSGFSITREVLAIEKTDQVPFDPSNMRVGELMKVIVTVHCNQDITFAAINDPIPAGCEVIDPELNTGERDIATKNTQWNGPSELSHSEFRDCRVLLFADDMPAGEYRFSYILKATTAGKFVWPASTVEAMYYPEFYGRGVETSLMIKDNR